MSERQGSVTEGIGKGETHPEQTMELIQEFPVLVGEHEASEACTIPAVELDFVAQVSEDVPHSQRALDDLCDSVPTRAHWPYEDFIIKSCGSGELCELCTDRGAVPYFLGELHDLRARCLLLVSGLMIECVHTDLLIYKESGANLRVRQDEVGVVVVESVKNRIICSLTRRVTLVIVVVVIFIGLAIVKIDQFTCDVRRLHSVV